MYHKGALPCPPHDTFPRESSKVSLCISPLRIPCNLWQVIDFIKPWALTLLLDFLHTGIFLMIQPSVWSSSGYQATFPYISWSWHSQTTGNGALLTQITQSLIFHTAIPVILSVCAKALITKISIYLFKSMQCPCFIPIVRQKAKMTWKYETLSYKNINYTIYSCWASSQHYGPSHSARKLAMIHCCSAGHYQGK